MSATSKCASVLNDNIRELIGVLLAVVILCIARTKNRTRRVPPGPPPAFLLGNASHLPKVRPWLKLHEWGRKYGALCYFMPSNIKFTFLRALRRCHIVHDLQPPIHRGGILRSSMRSLRETLLCVFAEASTGHGSNVRPQSLLLIYVYCLLTLYVGADLEKHCCSKATGRTSGRQGG